MDLVRADAMQMYYLESTHALRWNIYFLQVFYNIQKRAFQQLRKISII